MTDQDRGDHFFATLGTCWEAARVGGLSLRLELDDGTVVQGRPTASVTADVTDEIDEAGLDRHGEVDGRRVDLLGLRSFTVIRPGAAVVD